MTNHVHLVLQAGELLLAHFMQNIAFRHTQYINREPATGKVLAVSRKAS